MTDAPSILVIDDDLADRMAVRRAFGASYPDGEIEEAPDASAGLRRLVEGHHTCALVDYRLPDRNGLDLLREAITLGADTPIVILTGYGDELLAAEAIKAGAIDYLPKAHLNATRLQRCIEGAEAVRRHRSETVEERDQVASRMAQLTPRERQIMELLVAGQSNKSVAAELGISRRTVETHRARIMDKMQVRSLADLVHRVLRARGAGPMQPHR